MAQDSVTRMVRSCLAFPDLFKPRQARRSMAATPPEIREGELPDLRVIEQRIPVSRPAATLSVHEFLKGGQSEWEWCFRGPGGAFGTAHTRESALTAAFRELGVDVVFVPITTEETLEFVLAGEIARRTQ